MKGPTDAEIREFFRREESIRVRRRDPQAVNDAIDATMEAFGIERSRVVDVIVSYHMGRC